MPLVLPPALRIIGFILGCLSFARLRRHGAEPIEPDPDHTGGGRAIMHDVTAHAPLSSLAAKLLAAKLLAAKLRAERPLIHNITNFVVMNLTANALLAIGASPAMVHAVEEVADFVPLSRALVLNIGTLDAPFVAGMDLAVKAARQCGVPWLLDPVGAGATPYRTRIATALAAQGPAIIRGNAGEIIALAGASDALTKGVDSLAHSEAALDAARDLAAQTGAVIAVTGATDYVVSADGVLAVPGGHAMSQSVTGTGCATSAIIGAYLTVALPREAAYAGLTLMKRAAEHAAQHSTRPGRFAVALIDALHELTLAP
jgi:hydroxyethylthiazole kinase